MSLIDEDLNISGLFSEAAYEFPESTQWMPSWLTKHKGFEQVKGSRIFKIFSQFGLHDFRETFEDPSAVEEFRDFLMGALSNVVQQASGKQDSPELDRLEQVAYKLLQDVMSNAMWQLNKHRITKQIASEDKKLRLDAGMSVIKAYNTIRAYASTLGIQMQEVESSKEFKGYSKRGQFSVVFSTKPEDIAAMSSRSNWGTCQKIDVVQGLGGCLVGSILSKFVGIVYITTGSQYAQDSINRGERMEARCLVRFVIDTKTNKPALILDRMYPVYIPKFAQAIHDILQKRSSIPVHNISNSEDIGIEPENTSRFRMPEEDLPIKQHEATYLDTPAAFTNSTGQVKDPVKFVKDYIRNLYMWLEVKIAGFMAKANDHGAESVSSNARELAKSVFGVLLKEPGLVIAEHYKSGGKPMQSAKIKDMLAKEMLRTINKVKIRKLVEYFFSVRKKHDLMYHDIDLMKDLSGYIYDQLTNIPDELLYGS